jgi:hypothetical protein
MKKVLFLCCVLCFFSLSLFADTVVLKSGKQIEGTIVEKTNDSIKIDINGATLTYYLDDIATINSEAVVAESPVKAPTSAAITPPTTQTPIVIENMPQTQGYTGAGGSSAVSVPGQTGGVTQGENSEPRRVFKNKHASQNSTKEEEFSKVFGQGNPLARLFTSLFDQSGTAVAAVVGMIVIIIVCFWIFMYVFGAICLYVISRKTGKGEPILAWIPIGNLFLMCKIAGLSYFWIFALLLVFIPFIGGLLIAAGSVYLWYKIAQARNKPGWLGILTIIPLANFVVMGYLAFSE